MQISKQQIEQPIGYTKIREHLFKTSYGSYHQFDVLPDDESLPKGHILFCVSKDDYSLMQAGFGEMHDHFTIYETESENLKDALSFLRNLVSGVCYMVMKTDKNGNFQGGSVRYHPLKSFWKHMSFWAGSGGRFFKVTFNKPLEEVFVESKT